MAYTTYVVREVFKNGKKLSSNNSGALREDGSDFQFTANRNNIAIVDFPNDDDPADVHTAFVQADNLTNKTIDEWARNVIVSLNAQTLSLAAITVGQPAIPKPVTQEQIALQQKGLAFQAASVQAMVNFRNDPAEKTAYAELLAAQAAAAQAATASEGDVEALKE